MPEIMFTVIFNGLCVQKFQVVQMFSQLQKPAHTKLSVNKMIHLILFFVNLVIHIASRIAFCMF